VTQYRPFRRKRSFTLAAIIIIAAAALSYFPLGGLAGLRNLVITAVYPFQYATKFVWSGATGIPLRINRLNNLAKDNAALRIKVAEAAVRTGNYDELKLENERLRQALGFSDKTRYGLKLLPARVISRSGSPWFSVVEVDKGVKDGVKKEMVVLGREGLVGRVTAVSPLSAKVVLINDVMSSVAAADQRSRDFGVVEGEAPETLRLKYVEAGEDIKIGDLLVTASASSLYPPGIPIGVVTSARKGETDLFYTIAIKPSVKFSKLEEVFLAY